MPDWKLVRAAVVGGLYPNLVHAEAPVTTQGSVSASFGERNKRMRYSISQKHPGGTDEGSYLKSCNMHPNSLCFGQDKFQCPYLVYYTLQQTTKLYVYDSTEADPWALLLFGAQPVWNESGQTLDVGGWLRFHCESGELVLPLINAARKAIQSTLSQTRSDGPPFDATSSPALVACTELLRTGGIGYGMRDAPEWPILAELIAESEESKRLAEEQAAEAADG